MEFSRPQHCSGYHFPSPGDLPNPGIEPMSPALQADSLPPELSGKGMTKDEMIGWHHRLKGHEFEQTPGGGEEQGSLACCSP